MGLDTTHNAFHGAYSAFNRLRKEVARAAGGSFPPHDDETLNPEMWYIDDAYSEDSHPGLWEFLCHSDCDGDISPEMCGKIAKDLAALLPLISTSDGGGHLTCKGGYRQRVQQFIDGCRAAADAGESLGFH